MSYLCNRQFKVYINGTSSEKITINYSIPQGSILGPLLFNYYKYHPINHAQKHVRICR